MSGRALYEAGYTDLVLIRPKDKAPAKSGWLHNRPTRDQVTGWKGNIGVIAEGLPALDLDLYDDVLADEIQRHALKTLGAAPLRTSHRPASRLLVYRTSKPFPKKILTLPDGRGKVEVLGAGRQYLVYGTHPEGTDYGWARSALWDIPPVNLTSVSEEKVEAFLRELQELYSGVISTGRGKAMRRMEGTSRVEIEAPSLEHVTEALSLIPNTDAFLFEAFPGHTDPREAWIAFAHAVYGAGGREAEDAFVEWTATYEDGPVDLDKARDGYRSCADTYTGWPTLDRIVRDLCRPAAEDEFEADLGPAPEPPVEYPPAVRLTDEYVLDRLLPKLRDEVCFVAGDWYVWDGSTWRLDEMLRFESRVRDHLRVMAVRYQEQASFAPNKDEAKALRSVARRLQGATGIKAIMGLAAAPLSRPMADFDVDPLALNTPNGLVDLTTGEIRKTNPKDRVTRCTTVGPADSYDPEKAPNWSRFLQDLTGGDRGLERFLQRWMGYSITGLMTEKKLAFVWGSNSNTGKSTFVNAVNYAVGDYGRGVDVDNFTGRRGNTDSLAQLPGIRLASATEASAGQLWDDKIIKAITGGDRIEARRLYRSFFTFQPQFKMMIAGNHRPSLARVDGAMLKRILIIPMNYKVAPEDIDYRLGMKLQEEADQILRWMIEGALSWQRDGLNPPAAVLAATDEYTEEEDTLAEWLEEQCELKADSYTTTSDLYTNWKQWNRTRGSADAAGTAIGFARALSAAIDEHYLPIEKHRTETSRGFIGIRIRPRVALGTEEFDT